jgi:5-formyltetrahydrofolate cyclo-ligase
MPSCLVLRPAILPRTAREAVIRASTLHHRNMSTEAREAKRALRKTIKTQLASINGAEVATQSRTGQKLILSLPQYKDATRVSIYLSMPTGEAQTDLLVRDALKSGKAVFVPYLHTVAQPETKAGKAKVMDMLRLHSIDEYEGLERDLWGIPFLPDQDLDERGNAVGGTGVAERGEDGGGLDLVVVPGVAFDPHMNRIGHGAGFYDRYLTRYCNAGKRKKPFLVGLCLAEQVLPAGQIFMQDWDWKVDAVAVGDGRLLTSEDRR